MNKEKTKNSAPAASKSLFEEHEKFAKEIEIVYNKRVATGTITVGYNYIEFVHGQKVEVVKFGDHGFKEQVDLNLRKLGLK